MSTYENAPKVTVKDRDGNIHFLQVLDSSKTINKLIALGMESVKGTNFVLTVTNNGHVMEFPSVAVNLDEVARTANGIKITEPKAKEEAI
jgi:hypothetical protein